jgi:hypothetical protein
VVNRRKGVRDRWLPHVLDGHTGAGFGCRLMLTVMYFRMTEKGYVSIARTALADMLGVHPSQITKWTKEAIDVGLLQKVGGGYPGRTAWFVAVIPSGKVTRNWSPSPNGKVTRSTAPSSVKTGHLSSGQSGREGDLKLVTHHARVTNVTTTKSAPRKERHVLLSELSPWARLAYAPLTAVNR